MNNNSINERLVNMPRWQFAMECVLVFLFVAVPVFAVYCLGGLMAAGTVQPAIGSALAVFFAGPVTLLHLGFGVMTRRMAAKNFSAARA